MHGSDGNYYYKKRASAQNWHDVHIPDDKIYKVERHYCYNKTIPELKMMIVHVVPHYSGYVHPYLRVVCTVWMVWILKL